MPTTFAKVPLLPTMAVLDDGKVSPRAKTPQLQTMAPVAGVDVPKTSQLAVMVVYNEGGRGTTELRAWWFTMDGNYFYVLHLGDQGTWVYSLTTDTWSQWVTQGFTNWNAEYGFVWNNRVVAGDSLQGVILEVSPNTELDDGFRPIRRKATAIMQADSRRRTTVDWIMLAASVGAPSNLTPPQVTLSYSDDQGQTYTAVTATDITLGVNNFSQDIMFRSLGSFAMPNRVIVVEDVGGMVRIDRASVSTR